MQDGNDNCVLFCGGGSGGHVIPAITLINELKLKENFPKIVYIGGRDGIERELISQLGVPYHAIFTGKLRRYFSWENFTDVFKLFFGFIQCIKIILSIKEKNLIIFSTGGYVSIPPVLAAKFLGKKIFIHEQTSCVGLANRIASKFANKIFISYKNSAKYFPKERTIYSGYPIRKEIYSEENHNFYLDEVHFNEIEKPILFITGGGNGSKLLNDKIKNELSVLEKDFFIIHQVGKIFENEYIKFKSPNYFPKAFFGDEIVDIFKKSEIVISRAGAGTVCELMALKKKTIFVPLKIAQKNEQEENAKEAKAVIDSWVILEDEFAAITISELLKKFQCEKSTQTEAYEFKNGTSFLIDEILIGLNS